MDVSMARQLSRCNGFQHIPDIEKQHIKIKIQKQTELATEIAAEISATKTKLKALLARQETESKTLSNFTTLFSPIRVLPNDVLGYVFELACQGGRIEFLVPAVNHALPTTSTAMLISQTCKYWRDVAFNLPCLWNSIIIRYRQPIDHGPTSIHRTAEGIKLTSLHLAHTCTLLHDIVPLSKPLNLDLFLEPPPPEFDTIWQRLLALFFTNLGDWQGIRLRWAGYPHGLQSICPNAETTQLAIHDVDSRVFLQGFPSARLPWPRLGKLVLSSVFFPTEQSLKSYGVWGNLIELNLFSRQHHPNSPSPLLYILRETQQLVTLRYNNSWSWVRDLSRVAPSIVLANLATFELQDPTFQFGCSPAYFQYLRFPALKNFDLLVSRGIRADHIFALEGYLASHTRQLGMFRICYVPPSFFGNSQRKIDAHLKSFGLLAAEPFDFQPLLRWANRGFNTSGRDLISEMHKSKTTIPRQNWGAGFIESIIDRLYTHSDEVQTEIVTVADNFTLKPPDVLALRSLFMLAGNEKVPGLRSFILVVRGYAGTSEGCLKL